MLNMHNQPGKMIVINESGEVRCDVLLNTILINRSKANQ